MKDVINVDDLLVSLDSYSHEALTAKEIMIINKDLQELKTSLHSLLISKLPEKREETWLNKDLVENELEWALKALPVARDMGFNSAIDDVKAVLDELFRSGDES